ADAVSRDFYLDCSGHRRVLHSFPTRRSSDLGDLPNLIGRKGGYWSIFYLYAQMHMAIICMLNRHCAHRLIDGRKARRGRLPLPQDRKSTRLNSSHVKISYAVFCLKKKMERG